MWGGKPRQLLDEAGLRSWEVRDQPGAWLVQTNERYYGTTPDLLSASTISADDTRGGRYDQIQQASRSDIRVQHPDWIEARLEELRDRIATKGEISDTFAHAQAAMTLAPPSQITTVIDAVHDALRQIPLEPAGSFPFAEAAVHFVRRSPILARRIKFPSVFLRLKSDSELQQDDLPLWAKKDPDGVGFHSSFDLYSGAVLLDAYFTPLAGALSPYVWLLLAPKTYGIIGISLGSTAVAGFARFSNDPIQILNPVAGRSSIPPPEIDPSAPAAAFEWWTNALNRLFAVVSDVTLYVDSDGNYEPESHLHALLTIEQLFRRVHSMQYAHRDTHARRVLLFTLLDTLDRLTPNNLERNCSHRYAAERLSVLRSKIPANAAQILLPRAEDGVRALKEVRQGFFMKKNGNSARVTVAEADGSQRVLDADTAVAAYIKVLRNATHGHGAHKEEAIAKTNALLTQHNGDVPSDIGWLGYLYLLDILADPEKLRYALGPKKERKQQRKK
jgi:hypothetical protein